VGIIPFKVVSRDTSDSLSLYTLRY
jgi:hypothetical protein